MEHAYGRKEHAWSNYRLLLQISQLLNDPVRFTGALQKTIGGPAASITVLFGKGAGLAETAPAGTFSPSACAVDQAGAGSVRRPSTEGTRA